MRRVETVSPGAADPQAVAVRRAAQEFEALLLGHLLKSARRATESWGGGALVGGSSVWREVLDEHLALAVARAGGLGLARYLEEALRGR